MKFYKLRHNSFGVRGVVWISGTRSAFIFNECSKCQRSPIQQPKGLIQLQPERSKGTFWPDVLGEGGGKIGFCFSERVKNDWDEAGIKYGKAWLGKVLEPYPKKLEGTVAPNYYWIQAPKGVELDYKASGYTDVRICPKCGRVRAHSPELTQPFVFVPGTWDGSDIFGYEESSAMLFCTERVLELAIEKRWTNFWFSPIEAPPPQQPIPYLKLSKKSRK